MNETTQQFGTSWSLVLSQVAAILFGIAVLILFPLAVTISCVRRFRGDGRFALWLVIVWLIPILGPLFGLWVAQAFLLPRAPENAPQRSISN
jgi:hypothetical protein